MNKIDPLLSIQQGIYENLKFADSKAMSITAINIAIIGGLHALNVFEKSNFEIFTISCLSFLVLSLSIMASVQVLRPRGHITKNSKLGDICDPVKIANRDLDSYIKHIEEVGDEEFAKHIAVQIYDRSTNNRKKYYWLNLEIWIGMAGWGLALIAAFLKMFV